MFIIPFLHLFRRVVPTIRLSPRHRLRNHGLRLFGFAQHVFDRLHDFHRFGTIQQIKPVGLQQLIIGARVGQHHTTHARRLYHAQRNILIGADTQADAGVVIGTHVILVYQTTPGQHLESGLPQSLDDSPALRIHIANHAHIIFALLKRDGRRRMQRRIIAARQMGHVEMIFAKTNYSKSITPIPHRITTNIFAIPRHHTHVRDYRRPYFKHYFLAPSHVSVMAWDSKDIGGYPMWDRGDGFAVISLSKDHLDMTHLPCCYDPTLHTPSPIPFEQREYDVCMIGYMYPQRWRVVKALRKAGFKVLAGCGLVYENYVSAYHNARISLCISANKDVALRVIETARMGCVVLTDPCPDYQLLKPNGFYLLDSTESMEVVQAVKDVLREPEQAQAKIAQSMAWAEPYSWDHAAKKVEEWYDEHYCMELAQ